MITITIGSSSRQLEDASEGWITEQIVQRRDDRTSVCVRVEIHTSAINMVLATPGCGGGGGGRRPTATEQRIFDLWAHYRLNTADYSPGNVIAFLKRVTGYL